jgi:hypothetical protein
LIAQITNTGNLRARTQSLRWVAADNRILGEEELAVPLLAGGRIDIPLPAPPAGATEVQIDLRRREPITLAIPTSE